MELDDDSQLADDSSVDDLVPWNHVKDQTCFRVQRCENFDDF